MESACSATGFGCCWVCSIRVDVEDHVAGSVNLLWVWVGGTAVKEVVKGSDSHLCACVDFGGQVIEGMHGCIIN